MAALTLPFQRRLDAAISAWLGAPGAPRVDFSAPAGAPALLPPDSVTWRVMKNPVALIVGGVAAVILELAEPRVRTGVWEHTRFRSDPVGRMKRTGRAAMTTIYAPAETARAMIEAVNRRHGNVTGATPDGAAYSADEPALLNWVQATASFGFLEAYCRYARRLSACEQNQFYAEGAPIAALYGARGAPASTLELEALFARMRPNLEPSPIVHEFLQILARSDFLPAPLAPLKPAMIAAAIAITPPWTRELLGLTPRMPPGGKTLLRALGVAGEHVALRAAPPALACVRLRLAADYLYR
ncbi:MAG TPA: oxygenase MpaB family protein [Caulobacterales bacterium]|nr:oxygenase MpaB family protein [Caulobacterales bacterium]